MRKLPAIITLAIAFAAAPTSAEETRTTVKLDWQHLPRTGDRLVFEAAKMPASTIFYSVFASGNRVIRIYWDAGAFCKGVFAPAETPFLECGALTGYFRVTQAPGEMPFVEWVRVVDPSLPQGEPG